MSEIGRYIYGIINSNKEQSFGYNGMRECEEVYAIPYDNISAIVSNSEISDYSHMRKDVLAIVLLKHQRVIERIMSLEYTIIPMRLGTFAQDETEIKDILYKGYTLIKEILERVSNKIEIDVAATWSNFNSVLKEAGEEKEIKEFKGRFLANPKGVTIDDQLKVGFMVKKVLDEKRQNYANLILDALKTLGHDFKAHELMDDKMVANFAFLIDKARQKAFYERIEYLNNEFSEKLNFRCVGPLPPYSFCTLEIKKMEFKDLDWARKKLGLNDAVNKDEIKRAYQRAAFLSHPDKNPNISGMEREFDEIKKSYNILVDYGRACEQARQENMSFDEKEFKKSAILVKVKE